MAQVRSRAASGLSPLARPVVLIGAMAVGKTAIGSAAAAILKVAFEDTDAAVVARHGTIAGIFASHGEGYFRQLEAKVVASTLEGMAGRPGIVSLGGGAVLDSGTQQLLAATTVVYLEADRETVRTRIGRNTGRPLLQRAVGTTGTAGASALERWETLMAVRLPVYRRLADITLDVRQGTAEELAAKLAGLLLGPAPGTGTTTTSEKDPRQ